MKKYFLFAVCCLVALSARAQFYESGRPSGLRRWSVIEDDTTRVVFSRDAQPVGQQVMRYVELLRPLAREGYRYPAQRMPLVVWSGTALSNGLAMQAPRRVEFVAMPAVDSYSDSWLWQLAAHELRHTVQFSNINRHTVKALSYVFGEQVELIASGLMPFWLLEGDAVWNETRLSEWGRGEQPSFSMAYRALGDDLLMGKNVDRWFCGSYRDFIPDHYELGYQMVKYLNGATGRSVGNDVADYISRYPFTIFGTQLALKKHYGIYTPELFRRTFAAFNDDMSSSDEESAKPITRARQWTRYSYPQWVDDYHILALKTDYDDAAHWVWIDARDGSERFVRHVGSVSTRPEVWAVNSQLEDAAMPRVVWTEYRRSAIWDGEVGSVVMSMKVDGTDVKQLTRGGMALFPTFYSGGTIAWLTYNADGGYSLVCGTVGEQRLSGVEKSYHGLAWDEATWRFYMIALIDEGMYIESFDPQTGAQEYVTVPAHITLSDLRAMWGGLYFGAVASGRDEVHYIDLATGTESQITSSRYGAFNSSISQNGLIALTTYSKKGYGVSIQDIGDSKWEIDVRQEIGDSEQEDNNSQLSLPQAGESPTSQPRRPQGGGRTGEEVILNSQPYHKGLHLFRVHSWLPLDLDYEAVMSGEVAEPTLGATILSQNLLGTSFATLNYGYDAVRGYSSVRGAWRYEGFAPKLEIAATWSNVIVIPKPVGEPYSLTLSGLVYLPFVLSDGYHRCVLTPAVQYLFNNTKRWYLSGYEYATTFYASLSFSDRVRMAMRDLTPRWGYGLRAGYLNNMVASYPMQVVMLYGQVQTPALFAHHSFSLEVAAQRAIGTGYLYMAQSLIPRGVGYIFPLKYGALRAGYALPLAYPDIGIQGVVFWKRLWARLGADYAAWVYDKNYQAYSLGGTLYFDLAFFRMPAAATSTLSVSLFFPSNSTKPYFGVGFSAPL